MQQAYQRGASVPEMAALFAAIVERPADIPGEMAKREALTRTLFPEAAIRRASAVKYGGADVLLPARTDVDPLSAAYWWGVAGAVALLAGAIVWRRFRS
jgi:2-methylisocitrate lyase-like PEP mutase family enzyme